MKKMSILIMPLLLLASAAGSAQQSTARALFRTDVADATNQEILVLEVHYPPGVQSASHRHNAHTIVYVLEGRVTMQVANGDEQTLGPGEIFYESPADVHTVSRNASDTEPATILVFFLKERGAATTVPAP